MDLDSIAVPHEVQPCNISSNTQVSADSYKTTENYPTSDISDLGGCTYPQPTRIWKDPEVLKAMALEMPILEFPAEVLEPEYPPFPVHKPSKKPNRGGIAGRSGSPEGAACQMEAVAGCIRGDRGWADFGMAGGKRVEKEQVERLRREHEEHARARNTTLAAGEDDGTYEIPRARRSAEGKKGKGVTKFRFNGVEVPSPGSAVLW
uniref:Uncharacterized protein n=1 Tax=Moniliophthora roreri TaxID=221103 RepID=A0A0W0FMZ6_MONRR